MCGVQVSQQRQCSVQIAPQQYHLCVSEQQQRVRAHDGRIAGWRLLRRGCTIGCCDYGALLALHLLVVLLAQCVVLRGLREVLSHVVAARQLEVRLTAQAVV